MGCIFPEVFFGNSIGAAVFLRQIRVPCEFSTRLNDLYGHVHSVSLVEHTP